MRGLLYWHRGLGNWRLLTDYQTIIGWYERWTHCFNGDFSRLILFVFSVQWNDLTQYFPLIHYYYRQRSNTHQMDERRMKRRWNGISLSPALSLSVINSHCLCIHLICSVIFHFLRYWFRQGYDCSEWQQNTIGYNIGKDIEQCEQRPSKIARTEARRYIDCGFSFAQIIIIFLPYAISGTLLSIHHCISQAFSTFPYKIRIRFNVLFQSFQFNSIFFISLSLSPIPSSRHRDWT